MALRGWRLFGVAGTIFAYVIGILLLSLVSVQNPTQRRARSKLYGGSVGNDVDPLQTRMIGLLGKRQTLQWCRELRYINNDPVHTLSKPKTHPHLMQTFPGHYVKSKFDETETHIDREPIVPPAKKVDIIPNLIQTFSSSAKASPKSNNGDLIALASFPGSGNTWLRYLLQQATGIYTGSVYKDYGLLKSGFPAENVSNSSVLVIKTHEWGPRAWSLFSKSILLVRDPEKAILAEFNRQSGGHVGFASPDRYKRTKGRYWQQFVTNKLWAWEQMNLAWARNFTGEVKVVFYDELVEHVEQKLREILHFMKFPIDEDLLLCAMQRKEGIYRRKKRIMTFDPYSPTMHQMIGTKRNEVYATLGRIENDSHHRIKVVT